MVAVTRLVTFIDVVPDRAEARALSVSARLDAVLADGRRVRLLHDRGWSSWASGPDACAVTSAEEIEETARVVVGPDEPFGGRSHEDMAMSHWSSLAETLGRQGFIVDANELRRLPHDVELGDRLRARLARPLP